jgi:hypothetical protein
MIYALVVLVIFGWAVSFAFLAWAAIVYTYEQNQSKKMITDFDQWADEMGWTIR